MTIAKRLVAEGLGSALLVATVVGSGVMAERLASGNVAIALLANTGATVAILFVLIALLGPISGAHFNPAVSLTMAWARRLPWPEAFAYVFVQCVSAIVGTVLAHAMFELPLLSASTHVRSGLAQYVSEFVATFGLVLIVFGHRRANDAPSMVAAWIGAAYWFTASTSFANPAVTLARSFTDTFSGIRPADVLPFILVQLTGAAAALFTSRSLFPVGHSVATSERSLADFSDA